jgi:hypothetical protein
MGKDLAMNPCAFLDGYVQAALVINRTASTETPCPSGCATDYAIGWSLAVKGALLYRCMKPDLVECLAGEYARYELALLSSTVKGCKRCKGTGAMLIVCGNPEDYEHVQCTCVNRALDEIEQQIGEV